MIRSFVINKYIAKEFLKTTFNTCLIFFCLGFVMNLFEEINFFRDYQVNFFMPVMLSSLLVPSLLYNMFPFIIFVSGILFFLKIKKTDEIVAMKISGMSNISVLLIPSILSLILGIFFITSVNPVTAALVTKYESIKGSYEKDKEYLAAITENGIWIREKNNEKNNIIRSKNLRNNNLMEVTIYEFDKNNNFTRRVEAESANISSLKWLLKNVMIVDASGKILSQDIKEIYYFIMFDIKKIKSL